MHVLVGKLQDFMTKYVLFDDSIDWKRDVMRFKERIRDGMTLFIKSLDRKRQKVS